ncbi:MAG: hypothetical protein JF599_04670 [Verrucomicrobia bacterium]|nr:hypothetical protein [Verrucomicrobiota bacterium]
MAKIRAAEPLAFRSFKPETLRGSPGFFRVGQTSSGQWWLLDPHDRPFFVRSVAAVNRYGRAGPPATHRGVYAVAVDQLYGYEDPAGFARAALQRLRRWQVNTLGPWADPALAGSGLYATVLADFRHAGGPVIHAHGVNLPDVFDTGWTGLCDLHAAQTAAAWPPGLIGVFTDDALGWGPPRPDRLSLLQVCLSLEPNFAAYHAAWEFVLAPHGGNLAALGRSWSLDLPNREIIRQRTLEERPLATAGYLRDHERFAREVAHRYFAATAAALRRHHPHLLILGCRFAEPPGATVLAECVYPRVDVVSWHCHGPDFALHAEVYARAAGMPLLLTAAGLSNERFRAAPFKPHSGPTRLERMLRDGRKALTDACAHPSVIGYEWARWADEPDETPPFGTGLVHTDDREAVEHTELLAQINARAERLRLRAARNA